MQKLIKLIEEGDSGKILSEENFYPKLNELLKYDLVEIKDDKIYLTTKGIAAKKEGIDLAIRRAERQHYLDEQKRELEEKNLKRKIDGNLPNPRRYIKNLLLLLLSLIPLFLKLISLIRKKIFKNKSSNKR